METQKVLNGETACFIAALANAVSREIGKERMNELIQQPAKLKKLLLPLVDDDWIDLLPAVSVHNGKYLNMGAGKYQKLAWINWWNLYYFHHKEGLIVHELVEYAGHKKFAFLTEDEATALAELMKKGNPTAEQLSGSLPTCFPFLRGKKLLAWFVHNGEMSLEELGPSSHLRDANGSMVYFFIDTSMSGEENYCKLPS